MALLAPIALNKLSAAIGSDIKYSLGFYKIAKGG